MIDVVITTLVGFVFWQGVNMLVARVIKTNDARFRRGMTPVSAIVGFVGIITAVVLFAVLSYALGLTVRVWIVEVLS